MLYSMNSGVPAVAFLFLIVLSCSAPGHVAAAVVTLHSIQIYKTHELLNSKPTVYFQCKGENKTILPDVTKTNTVYSFKGEESWQPLTELSSKKCKRCGFYEKGFLSLNDVFDEWELCPSDFAAPGGTYTHVKEKELNATFLCPTCIDLGADSHADPSDGGGKGTSIALVILISAAVTIIVLVGFVGGYKYWQKRKRQREQARFLKLFEEHDDMEDELGLGEIV